ncbi:alpha/beta hydrolase fold domain protein [Burkholderia pseudomallei MSHR456]|nr:alpha/beta hydrolase fold domain protein [Burkholderia pseudomallei MSHR456]
MNAPECGTDTVVNVRTAAGCRPASAHATAAPQSCPTTWTGPPPSRSISATTSPTRCGIRYAPTRRGRASGE